MTRRIILAGSVILALALAGCDSAEERAEAHYQNALALLAEGDVPRAIVELRSVFNLDGRHREARLTLAKTLLEQGEVREAFSQYLRLAEQYPEDVETRLALAEIAITAGNFELAEEHATSLTTLDPDSPRTRIVQTAMTYRDAVDAEDMPTRSAMAVEARAHLDAVPDSLIARTIVIDSLMQQGAYAEALEELDIAQRLDPTDRRFYRLRLAAYARLENEQGLENTLQDMVVAFPDDPVLPQTLMQYYASRGNIDGAEAFLRARVVPGNADDGARAALIQFLSAVRGPAVALAEAQQLIDEGTNNDLFRSLHASLLYDQGRRDEALQILEDIVENAEPSDQTNNIKATYARLLQREGNDVGARAMVESVLEDDPGHVASLIMRAEWQIASDQTDDAILTLRSAQDQAPDTPRIFTLLADAYVRAGQPSLAGEMLSLAVDAANSAPAESLTYARFLMRDQRFLPAESVLIDSLRIAPDNAVLLAELGAVYIGMEDWPRTEQVRQTLLRLDTEQSRTFADQIRLAMLRAQGETDEAIAFLETLGADAERAPAAEIAIVSTLLEEGDVSGARARISPLLAADPQNPNLRFLDAAIDRAEGDIAGAEATYRALAEEGIGGQRVWVELIRMLGADGRSAEAEAALDQALAAIPDGPDLLWMRASVLERERDFEGAIAIYEQLYAHSSASTIVANNLASLLSAHRSDPESLERASRIAQRLNGTDIPPFQDTYGWIAYQNGRYQEALEYLRPAAEALTDDPLVQAHLGLTLAALDQRDEAMTQLAHALDMAGDDPRPAFQAARAALAELQNGDTGALTDD